MFYNTITVLLVLAVVAESRCDNIVVKGYSYPWKLQFTVNISSITDLVETLSVEPTFDSVTIKMQHVPTLPSEALSNLKLRILDIFASGLKNIEPGALDGANISFLSFTSNEMEKMKNGVFNNMVFRILWLDRNKISHIEPGAFDGMVVERLYLGGNRLIKIASSMFDNLTMTTLNINDNEIYEIEDGAFQNIAGLNDIDLSGNKLEIIGDTFKDLRTLTDINLENNKIKELPSDTFKGTSLVRIHLGENKLTVVRNGVFNNLPIKLIDLSSNQITTIESGAFADINTLTTIYLSRNSFVGLEPSFFEGISGRLKSLRLDYNNISYIAPGTFKHLKIHELSLRYNKLKEINPGIVEDAVIDILRVDGD